MNTDYYKKLSKSDLRVLDFLKSKSFGGVFTLSQSDVSRVLEISLKTVNRAFLKLQQLHVISKSGKVWALSPVHFFNLPEEDFGWKMAEFSGLVEKSPFRDHQKQDEAANG